MEYRRLPKGDEQISVIGIGSASIHQAGEREIEETLTYAVESGVNYFDMGASNAKPFPAYGRALSGCRDRIYYQIHFGADYTLGAYGWTTNLDTIRRSVEWLLATRRTDYIDFGFIHCLDQDSDLQKMEKNGVLRLIQDLKSQGVIRHIGLSSHTPDVAGRVLDMRMIDMLMFSINPGYDYHHGEYAAGSADERMALYQRCEAEGVGISVMKVFSGGQLLDAKTSPFGRALSEYQLIQYALDRPGVLTVLPGVRNPADLKRILGYFDASKEARDYAVLGEFTPKDAEKKCVYCSHCQPCPAGLDVALINKYYDLARAGDAMAKGHYAKLEKNPGDCIGCGHCNVRCPFRVDQAARMQRINAYFA